jgi:hypothetical protein
VDQYPPWVLQEDLGDLLHRGVLGLITPQDRLLGTDGVLVAASDSLQLRAVPVAGRLFRCPLELVL